MGVIGLIASELVNRPDLGVAVVKSCFIEMVLAASNG